MSDMIMAVRSKISRTEALTESFSYVVQPELWTITDTDAYYTSDVLPSALSIRVEENDVVKLTSVINLNTGTTQSNGYGWAIYTTPASETGGVTEPASVKFGYLGSPPSAPSVAFRFDGYVIHNSCGNNTSTYVTGIESRHPVGSVYISKFDVSPALLFGGTWQKITGRFLLATGANTTNNSTYFGTINAGEVNAPAGETGGEAWHSLTVSEMPSHNHTQNSHSHGVGYRSSGGSGSTRNGPYGQSSSNVGNISSAGTTATNQSTGGSNGTVVHHNNMPPYYAMHMWERIA